VPILLSCIVGGGGEIEEEEKGVPPLLRLGRIISVFLSSPSKEEEIGRTCTPIFSGGKKKEEGGESGHLLMTVKREIICKREGKKRGEKEGEAYPFH